jgi:thioesterase domain-containing protein
MAASYLDAVREVQPAGPYSLGGWSFGGLVAFEMARQLVSAGEEVAILVLFEVSSETPPLPGDATSLLAWNAADRGLDVTEAELRERAWDEQIALFAERAAAAGLLPRGTGLSYVRRLVAVHLAHVRAAQDYVPGPYAGHVALLRIAPPPLSVAASDVQRLPAYGWDRYLSGCLDVLPVPGEHRTLMHEPHVRGVAATLRAVLGGFKAE